MGTSYDKKLPYFAKDFSTLKIKLKDKQNSVG